MRASKFNGGQGWGSTIPQEAVPEDTAGMHVVLYKKQDRLN